MSTPQQNRSLHLQQRALGCHHVWLPGKYRDAPTFDASPPYAGGYRMRMIRCRIWVVPVTPGHQRSTDGATCISARVLQDSRPNCDVHVKNRAALPSLTGHTATNVTSAPWLRRPLIMAHRLGESHVKRTTSRSNGQGQAAYTESERNLGLSELQSPGHWWQYLFSSRTGLRSNPPVD